MPITNCRSPFKRAVSGRDFDIDSEQIPRQPRLSESTQSPASAKLSYENALLVKTPLMTKYMNQFPDVQLRFYGIETRECSDSSTNICSRIDLEEVDRGYPSCQNQTDSVKVLLHEHGVEPEPVPSSDVFQGKSKTVPDTVDITPVASMVDLRFKSLQKAHFMTAPTISDELHRVFSSVCEKDVADSLTLISLLAYQENSLNARDVLARHHRTQLLIVERENFRQSGLSLIATLMRQNKWCSDLDVQQAALVVITCGVKLTFDCDPSDLMKASASESKLVCAAASSVLNVLKADTYSLIVSVLSAIELGLRNPVTPTAQKVVYSGLGALWHLVFCPFRRFDSLWLLLWKENGIVTVFEALVCFPTDLDIQKVGKAIIMSALRHNKTLASHRIHQWKDRS